MDSAGLTRVATDSCFYRGYPSMKGEMKPHVPGCQFSCQQRLRHDSSQGKDPYLRSWLAESPTRWQFSPPYEQT
jgi:hypothetical protein